MLSLFNEIPPLVAALIELRRETQKLLPRIEVEAEPGQIGYWARVANLACLDVPAKPGAFVASGMTIKAWTRATEEHNQLLRASVGWNTACHAVA